MVHVWFMFIWTGMFLQWCIDCAGHCGAQGGGRLWEMGLAVLSSRERKISRLLSSRKGREVISHPPPQSLCLFFSSQTQRLPACAARTAPTRISQGGLIERDGYTETYRLTKTDKWRNRAVGVKRGLFAKWRIGTVPWEAACTLLIVQ